jgi:hypothetical protein
MPTPPPSHPSALRLHQHQLAALPAAEAQAVQDHLAGCERCRQEIDALAGHQAQFLREVLPRTAEGIGRRTAPVASRWHRWLLPVMGGLAVATALVLVARPIGPPSGGEPVVQTKGGAPLTIIAQHDGQQLTVDDGVTRLRAGDRIRFVVRPGDDRFVLIASVDGNGHATIYHPFNGEQSAPIEDAPRVEIPGSIALDATPGPERVFILLSRQPLKAAVVRAALDQVGAQGLAAVRTTPRLPVDADSQSSVLFEKVP